MKLSQLIKRLDEASTVVVPRLRAAGEDVMADAVAFEVFVIRQIAPKNRKLWSYYEGFIFGLAHAAGVAEAVAGHREAAASQPKGKRTCPP